MLKALLIWFAGILLLVPYSLYRAFTLEFLDYIFWLGLSLGWLILYWPVAGPIVTFGKIRHIYRVIAENPENRKKVFEDSESADTAIEFISQITGVPEFIARKVYDRLLENHQQKQAQPAKSTSHDNEK